MIVIVIGVWVRALVWFQGGHRPNIFNVFKVIKPFKMALEKLDSWSKKLHLFITNIFFLAEHNTTHKRLSHPVASAFGQLLLWRDIYLAILHSHGDTHYESTGKQVSRNKHNFATVCLFSFKIKHQDLII